MNEYDLNEMRNEQGVYVNVETTNKFLRKVFEHGNWSTYYNTSTNILIWF